MLVVVNVDDDPALLLLLLAYTVIVIPLTAADASKIKSASEHISFLKKCRVMIVAD